jgi:hypothetical protein
VVNNVWKRFWWYGTRRSQNRAKRHKLNLCYDSRRNLLHPAKPNGDLCMLCCQLLTTNVDPHSIWITACGNLSNYPSELSTRTAVITLLKLMWNSVLSTKGANYMCLDLIFFYLSALLHRYKYMKIPLLLFPDWIKKQNNLDSLALDGFVFLEMHRTVWGLSQAGILVNKLLQKRLLQLGYYKCANTPGLRKHSHTPNCVHSSRQQLRGEIRG